MSQHEVSVTPTDRLTPTEEATANAIEADFQKLFDRWGDLGFPRDVVVPMAFIVAVDVAKKSGVSFERAIETMQLIWHGKEPS